jgi:hypothetical protein
MFKNKKMQFSYNLKLEQVETLLIDTFIFHLFITIL